MAHAPLYIDDDGIPRHDVRERNDSNTTTVRNCRRNRLGAVRRACARALFYRAKPEPAAIPQCALAHDVRRSRESHTATRYVATVRLLQQQQGHSSASVMVIVGRSRRMA